MSDLDYVSIVLGDPRLTNEERELIYKLGCEYYGEVEGGFESIKILTIDEADKLYFENKKVFDPLMKGGLQAKKILDFINNQDQDIFANLENLNKFLLTFPLDAYTLMKLITLIVNNEKKVQRSLAAIKGHIETYELKKQAIEYWRENINPKLSNPKAADLLIKVVPLSHRKLVEYVAEAKREKIRSAS